MGIQVGSRPESSFLDPLGMLVDCHRRVQRFLATLVTLSRDGQGGALSEDQREALAGALDYFRDAAPRHTADEEVSLFPRLQALPRSPERERALAMVAFLEADHVTADPLHADVELLGRRWLRENELTSDAAERLANATAALHAIYGPHIAKEDGELFPLARVLLDAEALTGIGREMAARRGIDFEAWRQVAAGL